MIFILHFRCDADPETLAKYIVALVKKEKSEEELRGLCHDQLEVFLQQSKWCGFFSFHVIGVTSSF